jgi:hypothetical protein
MAQGWPSTLELASVLDENKKVLDTWRHRLGPSSSSTNTKTTPSQGISTAMDARLEFGVELNAEMKLRVS